MTDSNAPVLLSPFQSKPIDDALTDGNGRILPEMGSVVGLFVGTASGGSGLDKIHIQQGSIQDAAEGAIQDPAGSAVGGSFAGAGGASGAIYKKFNGLPDPADHLVPIPNIPPGASVFNASKGQGGRVLHTYSPNIGGLDPTHADNRGTALIEIANAYYGALIAFDRHRSSLGSNGKCLNLIPISANIFAGGFANSRKEWHSGTWHLDPSYTLSAIWMALEKLQADGETIPELTLFFYETDVFNTAVSLQKGAGHG